MNTTRKILVAVDDSVASENAVRYVGRVLASAIPAVVVALAILALLFSAEPDSFAGILGAFVFFAGPWVVANFIGLMVWPAREAPQANIDTDCFS